MNDQSLNDFLGDLKEENFSINRQEIREISEFILGISYVDLLIGSPKITLNFIIICIMTKKTTKETSLGKYLI